MIVMWSGCALAEYILHIAFILCRQINTNNGDKKWSNILSDIQYKLQLLTNWAHKIINSTTHTNLRKVMHMCTIIYSFLLAMRHLPPTELEWECITHKFTHLWSCVSISCNLRNALFWKIINNSIRRSEQIAQWSHLTAYLQWNNYHLARRITGPVTMAPTSTHQYLYQHRSVHCTPAVAKLDGEIPLAIPSAG